MPSVPWGLTARARHLPRGWGVGKSMVSLGCCTSWALTSREALGKFLHLLTVLQSPHLKTGTKALLTSEAGQGE